MHTIQTFASLTYAELAPIFVILAGMLVGFYKLLEFVLNKAEKTANADREERKALAEAIGLMADGMQAVAVSNTRIADESEKRNGHLAEISVENKDQILTAVTGLATIIENQIVEKQTVKEQTVEHEQVISKE